jgi:heterodisulfide reductase subunit B
MCHANLDTRQSEIAKKIGLAEDMPVLYFSQVLGYAMGLEEDRLGLKKHIVDPLSLIHSRSSQRASEAKLG